VKVEKISNTYVRDIDTDKREVRLEGSEVIYRYADASPDIYDIDYLSATSLTGFGTDYRKLVTTTETADTTTSVKHEKTAAPVYFFYDPFTTGSTTTGTPSATVLKGYGWRSDGVYNKNIPAGTWQFNLTLTCSSATGTEVIEND
jgi:hypothetical protein